MAGDEKFSTLKGLLRDTGSFAALKLPLSPKHDPRKGTKYGFINHSLSFIFEQECYALENLATW